MKWMVLMKIVYISSNIRIKHSKKRRKCEWLEKPLLPKVVFVRLIDIARFFFVCDKFR
jgi:hypothetical protein